MSRTDVNESWILPGFTTTRSVTRSGDTGWVTTQTNGSSGSRFRSGKSTPDYHTKLVMGQLPENTFAFTESTSYRWTGRTYIESLHPIFKTLNRSWRIGIHSQISLSGADLISSARKFNLENQVKTKALLKLKDQDVNMWQAWAERDQLARLLTTTANRLSKSYSALRRGDFGSAAAALGIGNPGGSWFAGAYAKNQSKAIARGWLELQYGWTPAIKDLYGYAENLNKILAGRSPRRKIRARSKITENSTMQTRDGNRVTTYIGECEYTVSLRAVYARVQPQFTELSAIGLTNPFTIAWELTKWSFVVDWALKLGNWISSLDSTLGYEFVGGSVTKFERSENIGTITCHGPYNGSVLTEEQQTARTETVSCSRSPLTAFTSHALFPAVADPTSMMHALNALALLTTLKR